MALSIGMTLANKMFMLPVQVNPSPVYPGRQVHVKLPTLLVQLASALQPPLFVAHSLISVQWQFYSKNNGIMRPRDDTQTNLQDGWVATLHKYIGGRTRHIVSDISLTAPLTFTMLFIRVKMRNLALIFVRSRIWIVSDSTRSSMSEIENVHWGADDCPK